MISLVVFPLLSRLPNSIVVTTDRLVIGRTTVPFANVEYALVGSIRIADNEHPVLTFRERGGQVHMYGLGRNIDAHELANFLESVGIREPQACLGATIATAGVTAGKT